MSHAFPVYNRVELSWTMLHALKNQTYKDCNPSCTKFANPGLKPGVRTSSIAEKRSDKEGAPSRYDNRFVTDRLCCTPMQPSVLTAILYILCMRCRGSAMLPQTCMQTVHGTPTWCCDLVSIHSHCLATASTKLRVQAT